MHGTHQKHLGHWSWVGVLPPDLPVQRELLSDDFVDIQVLGHVEVVFGGVFQGRLTMCAIPHGRMGLLVGFGHRQGLVKMPVLALIRDGLLRPRFQDDLQGLVAHGPPCRKGRVPAHKLMLVGPQASAELQSPARQVVQHGGILGQTERVMQGQLIDHGAKAYATGVLGHRTEIDTRGGDLTHMGVLVLDNEIGAVSQ